MQGSSCPRPELGEFISPLLCGGAAAAAARGAASRASGRRWPAAARAACLARAPAVPPAAAGAAGASAKRPPGRPGGLRCPFSRTGPGLRCGRPPCAPHSPSPSFAFQAPPRIWRLLPRPPWRPAWGRHSLRRIPGQGSLGWSAPPQPPGAPSDHPLACPALSPCGGERPAVRMAGASLLGHWHLQRGLQGDQSPSGDGTAWTEA